MNSHYWGSPFSGLTVLVFSLKQVPRGSWVGPSPGQGGKGLQEVQISYLEFGGAPFISNQQQVTLTIHYNLLLKSATLGREQSSS